MLKPADGVKIDYDEDKSEEEEVHNVAKLGIKLWKKTEATSIMSST